MTAIIDYGAGNLTSVRNAFAALGAETVVTRDAGTVARADRLIFPGVGAAKSAMGNLQTLKLDDAVRTAANSGRPFLGICLGMQILFAHSEEDGGVDTLGVFDGNVRRFPNAVGFKVPEIGWNQVRAAVAKPLPCGDARTPPLRRCGVSPHHDGDFATTSRVKSEESRMKNGSEFYFVHSYYAEVVPETVGVTEYAGVKFTAMVKRGKLWACQFHPEKSGRIGLDLLSAWLKQ